MELVSVRRPGTERNRRSGGTDVAVWRTGISISCHLELHREVYRKNPNQNDTGKIGAAHAVRRWCWITIED